MTGQAIRITRTGLVTPVGLNSASSCAAIRCALDNFQATSFMDLGGEWTLGAEIPFNRCWRGGTRLLKMAAAAVSECLSGCQTGESSLPLLLCLPERRRVGRMILDDRRFFQKLQSELRLSFGHESRVIADGNVSVAVAMHYARELLQSTEIKQVLIAAVDSFLSASTMKFYESQNRLLTSKNSDGFIPGEAGAALLIERAGLCVHPGLNCTGIGFAVEEATLDSGLPLRGTGLADAITQAVRDSGIDLGSVDFRIADVSGERYKFKEASLGLLRTLRHRKEEFDIWHPADCVGEVGAAAGAVMIAVIKFACDKGYSAGNRILMHLGSDDGKRSALILNWQSHGALDVQ